MRKRLLMGIALAAVLALPAGTAAAARGNAAAGQITVVYETPKTQDEATLMQLVKVSQVDKVAAILSKALVLPRNITIRITRRDIGPLYDPGTRTIFYGTPFAALTLNVLEKQGLSGEELGKAFASIEYFVLFHELGHALVDAWHVPVLGREEDAVDAFSTILLVDIKQSDVAVWGAAFFDAISSGQVPQAADYADEHSLSKQRAYSIACWVYGASPGKYPGLAKFIPKERLVRCPAEYRQLRTSWFQFIRPHLRSSAG